MTTGMNRTDSFVKFINKPIKRRLYRKTTMKQYKTVGSNSMNQKLA